VQKNINLGITAKFMSSSWVVTKVDSFLYALQDVFGTVKPKKIDQKHCQGLSWLQCFIEAESLFNNLFISFLTLDSSRMQHESNDDRF